MLRHKAACFLVVVLALAACSPSSPPEGAYRKSIKAADETATIRLLHTIATAQTQSKVTRGAYGDFDSLVQAGFLDQRFAGTSPDLNGYRFTMKASEAEFSVNADPVAVADQPATANRHFYLDSADNVIHVNAGATATKGDPAL
jgi:hypothetical protein